MGFDMCFDDFKEQIIVFTAEESNLLRSLYIEKFIDTNKEYYIQNILIRTSYVDGYCYTGYLWDCLFQYNRVTIQNVFEKLAPYKEVLVFWDIHTCERILIENYWRFPKEW